MGVDTAAAMSDRDGLLDGPEVLLFPRDFLFGSDATEDGFGRSCTTSSLTSIDSSADRLALFASIKCA